MDRIYRERHRLAAVNGRAATVHQVERVGSSFKRNVMVSAVVKCSSISIGRPFYKL